MHITAILGESVVFNCHVEFPGEHPVPYVLQWEKKVGDAVRYRTIPSALYIRELNTWAPLDARHRHPPAFRHHRRRIAFQRFSNASLACVSRTLLSFFLSSIFLRAPLFIALFIRRSSPVATIDRHRRRKTFPFSPPREFDEEAEEREGRSAVAALSRGAR